MPRGLDKKIAEGEGLTAPAFFASVGEPPKGRPNAVQTPRKESLEKWFSPKTKSE